MGRPSFIEFADENVGASVVVQIVPQEEGVIAVRAKIRPWSDDEDDEFPEGFFGGRPRRPRPQGNYPGAWRVYSW